MTHATIVEQDQNFPLEQYSRQRWEEIILNSSSRKSVSKLWFLFIIY